MDEIIHKWVNQGQFFEQTEANVRIIVPNNIETIKMNRA